MYIILIYNIHPCNLFIVTLPAVFVLAAGEQLPPQPYLAVGVVGQPLPAVENG